MDELKQTYEDRLLRVREVLSLVPVSRAAWWKGVKEGRYPKPVKLGARTTCWRLSDLQALIRNGVDLGKK